MSQDHTSGVSLARNLPGAEAADFAAANGLIARLERLPFLPFHRCLAGILGAGLFFNGYDTLILSVVLVPLILTFHLSTTQATLLLSSGYVGQFLGSLGFGLLSERRGRKVAFVSSMYLFGLLSFAAALAWNFSSLLVFRALQGLGIGAVPVATALFNEYVRGKNRGRLGTLFELTYQLGYLATPLLALFTLQFVGPLLGWRLLLLFGALPLVIAMVAQRSLPESARWLISKGRIPEAEAIVNRAENEATERAMTLAPLDAQESLQADLKPTRFGELFSRAYIRRTLLTWTQWFTGFFVLSGYSNWLPTLYVRLGHLPQGRALWLTLFFSAAELVVLIFVAQTSDRFGRKPWFLFGFALATLGAAVGLVCAAVLHITIWFVLAFAGLLVALGSFINVTGVFVYSSELFPTRMRAWAMSTGRGSSCLANIAAALALGLIINAGLGVVGIFAVFVLVSFAGLLVMATLGIETKQRVLEELAQ
jgi:putative MFS transporter